MKPFSLSDFPNRDIIKILYEQWRCGRCPDLSSHWTEFGLRSRVQIENNILCELQGVGFGDCQANRKGHIPFHYATIASYLLFLRNRCNVVLWMMSAKRVLSSCRPFNFFFSYDVFRQCCIASLLESHIAETESPSILLIGDGYGILSAMLKIRFPRARLFLVDILPALLFQAIVLGRCVHKGTFHLVLPAPESGNHIEKVSSQLMAFCPAEHLDRLAGQSFTHAVNVASMQEMRPDVIRKYFTFLRAHVSHEALFYCCNRRSKVLPCGEVIRFADYPWHEQDRFIIDEQPPFHRWFFSPYKTLKHLKIGKVPVPLGRLFDGPMHHRMGYLKPQSDREALRPLLLEAK